MKKVKIVILIILLIQTLISGQALCEKGKMLGELHMGKYEGGSVILGNIEIAKTSMFPGIPDSIWAIVVDSSEGYDPFRAIMISKYCEVFSEEQLDFLIDEALKGVKTDSSAYAEALYKLGLHTFMLSNQEANFWIENFLKSNGYIEKDAKPAPQSVKIIRK